MPRRASPASPAATTAAAEAEAAAARAATARAQARAADPHRMTHGEGRLRPPFALPRPWCSGATASGELRARFDVAGPDQPPPRVPSLTPTRPRGKKNGHRVSVGREP